MRILVCNWKDTEHPLAGGAEVLTRWLGRHWVRLGHEVTWASSAVRGRPAEADHDGIRVLRGGDHRAGVHRHARAVYRAEGGDFDVVVDEINTRPFAAPAWATSSAVVALAHQVAREVWMAETPAPVAVVGRYVLEPLWLRRYRDVPTFTVSPSSMSSLRGYGLRDVRLLPMPSDLHERPARPAVPKATVPTFVFVGRLSGSKRPLDIVRAFRTVRRTLHDARLVVVGDGPLRVVLEREAVDGVEVWGHVPAALRDEAMASAHALVMASVREGWGLVVSEAAAVGTLTVAYRSCGLVDSVAAAGGILTDPDPGSLAAGMLAAYREVVDGRAPTGHGTVPWSVTADALLAGAAAVAAGRPTAGRTGAGRRVAA